MDKPILTISCPAKILPDQLDALRQRFNVVELGCAPDEKEIIKGLANAAVYVIGGDETVTAEVIRQSPLTKLHIFLGLQWETAYTKEARELLGQQGIAVEATGGGLMAVAKTTAKIIANPLTLRSMDARSIGLPFQDGPRGYQVDIGAIASKLKVAIIGAGNIGSLVAEELAAVTANGGSRLFPGLSYFDQEEKPELSKLGIPRLDDIGQAFQDADIVTVHLKYVEGKTDLLITPALINQMSESGLFINTARAELIRDERLLWQLIDSSPRRRFIFDPFYAEGKAFLDLSQAQHGSTDEIRRAIALSPNVTLTQHSAAVFDPETARITHGEYGNGLFKILDQQGFGL